MGQARAWLCHHASAHASDLERITPPKLHFEILTPRPIPMEAGTVIGYRLRLFGVPCAGRRASYAGNPIAFVDEQLRVPHRVWEHTHSAHR